jgi:hypothetical protein
MKLGVTWVGDVVWEVIEPLEGASLYREYLEARGPGVQHVAADTRHVSFQEAAERLAQHSHPFAQTGAFTIADPISRRVLPVPARRAVSAQFGYVDGRTTLRTAVELIRYPFNLSERFCLRTGKPDYSIPGDGARFEEPLANLRIGRLVKIGIVTRDLASTACHWMNIAGVERWHLFDVDSDRVAEITDYGSADADRIRVGWALIGSTLLELVQPTGGSGLFQSLLDTSGEGVAWLGVTARSSFNALVEYCERLGYRNRMRGPLVGRHSSAWFEARDSIGTDVEVLSPDEQAELLFTSVTPDQILAT